LRSGFFRTHSLSEELKTLQARFKESLPSPSEGKEEAKEKKLAPAAEKK
jgi:hypothetical protein